MSQDMDVGNTSIQYEDEYDQGEIVVKYHEKNGIAFKLTKHNPHGFWKISPMKACQMPASIRGQFTSLTQAIKALETSGVEPDKLKKPVKTKVSVFTKED